MEYWWRAEWKSMKAHRDVDETVCATRVHVGKVGGVQRCPDFGHVLYVDVDEALRGPTCVWEEVPDEALDHASSAPPVGGLA